MQGINIVTVGGNLVRDPEIRYTTGGSAVCNLSLAINQNYLTKDGIKKEDVCFIDIEAWNTLAENCRDHLSKGSPVLVEGRLKQDNWTKDGQKRSKHKVKARAVHFLSGMKKRDREEEDSLPEFE